MTVSGIPGKGEREREFFFTSSEVAKEFIHIVKNHEPEFEEGAIE